MIYRIAITGPESTGKSWLTERLAAHFETNFVPEYSRSYLAKLSKPYGPADILAIAKGQRQQEIDASLDSRGFLFCDTEPIVTKIWSEHAFIHCDEWILQEIAGNPHDFYLLCNIDLPWEPDPLREHPHLRDYLFGLYLNELKNRNLPFAIVNGNDDLRLACAINIITDRFLSIK